MDPESGTRARILFADDDPMLRRMFRRLAERAGYSVDLAADGDEALDAAATRSYAAIVTDHQMPGTAGKELLRRLREQQPDAALILVTGFAQHAVESCRVPGLFVVVSKPWDNDALIALLSASLHRWRAQRDVVKLG